jgi:hypothetical protein
MRKQPLPLNRAGRAYVIGAVVLSTMVVLIAVVLIGGVWRVPLLWMPRAVFSYVWTMFTARPALAGGGALVAAAIIGGSAYWARWRVNTMEQCVGEPKEGVTAGTGVLLLARDVTIGLVVTILELVGA